MTGRKRSAGSGAPDTSRALRRARPALVGHPSTTIDWREPSEPRRYLLAFSSVLTAVTTDGGTGDTS